MSDLIADLPDYLRSRFINTWLQMADVCMPDSAYCNKSTRPVLLGTLASYVISEVVELWDDELRWMILRGIGAAHGDTAENDFATPQTHLLLLQLLNTSGRHLRKLCITPCGESGTPQVLMDVALRCSNLSDLTIYGLAGEAGAGALHIVLNCSKHLRRLELVECEGIWDAFLGLVCPALEILDMGVDEADSLMMGMVASACPGLKTLIVNTEGNKSLEAIAKHCTLLVALNISWSSHGNAALPAVGITALVASCTHLRYIRMPRSSSDAALTAVSHCKSLEYLDLDGCTEITDAAIFNTVAGLPHLQGLDISNCSKLTDAALTAVADNCLSLEMLGLNDLPKINGAGLEALARWDGCKQLKDVSLCGLQSSAAAFVVDFVKNSPQIKFMGIDLTDKMAKILFMLQFPSVEVPHYNPKGTFGHRSRVRYFSE
jgi:hypothetical protein